MPVSVVIPAYNAGQHLGSCLSALCASREAPAEIIVVDDASTDETSVVAAGYPVKTVRTETRRGPASARNLGAQTATGDLVLFLDSDVCVREDTVERIAAQFAADPELDALLGAYDSEPQAQNFVSQYRNLMHTYVHRSGNPRASTFWSGCGAIRRSVFLRHGGFCESFERPSIEDIELGYRLSRSGCKILLDSTIEVQHLKRWTLWSMLKTDIRDRGIPWTELILRDRFMPDDLNLRISQRVSVALGAILAILVAAMALLWRGAFLAPLLSMVLVVLAPWWRTAIRLSRDPLTLWGLSGVALLAGLLAYQQGMTGLLVLSALNLAMLPILRRYQDRGNANYIAWLSRLYAAAAVFVSALYLPPRNLVACGIVILVLLGAMNAGFYIFLADRRGVRFMLAAVPFHVLYHVHNGLSFAAGLVRHLGRSRSLARRSAELVSSDAGRLG